jgi:rare lipoprotein A
MQKLKLVLFTIALLAPMLQSYVTSTALSDQQSMFRLRSTTANHPINQSTNQPITQSTSLDEYGVASYYGDEFHGRKTASGEKYNKNELTCAHKTYPFGTKIRVSRLDNKKSVIVRVNDRGPFIKGYIVDLSKKAAQEIGMIEDGIVKVKVELVEKKSDDSADVVTTPEERSTETTAKGDDTPAPTKAPDVDKPAKTTKKVVKKKEETVEAPKEEEAKLVTAKSFKANDLYQIELKSPKKSGYGVQIAIISNYENVFKEVAKLQSNWGGKVLVSVDAGENEDKTSYRLIIGPFDDKKSAEKNQKSAVKKGYKKCFVLELAE